MHGSSVQPVSSMDFYTRCMTTRTPESGAGDREALEQLLEADAAVFQAVAGWHSPILDRVIPVVSESANNSVLWIGTAAVIAGLGGRKGRFVAAEALIAVAVTSALTNVAAKRLVQRERPEATVPASRRIEQPDSSSFPSGHTASAAAFSAVIGNEITPMYIPVNLAAGTVGFSRVYTGVHYPGDVLVGWMIGRLIGGIVRMLWPKRWH
jgi:membrane-associated phospholipid phosphatase